MEKLIVINNSQNIIVNIPLYDYIKLQYNKGNSFVVCNITKEEMETMKEQMKHGELYELAPRLGREKAYNSSRYMMSYNSDTKEMTINNYEDEEDKGSYIFKDNTLKYDANRKDINRGCMKIYTTREYRSVLNYLISNTKNLKDVREDDLVASIIDVEKQIELLKEKKYKLLSYQYDNMYLKK